MAFASHILFFALSHLLLLLLIQSCPNSISFDCPDHAYSNGRTSLDFPFTNSSLPECGVCMLTCGHNNQTVINCVGWNPDAPYQALDINPSKHTLVVRYPHPCEAYTYSNASFPKTPSVSFTILQALETVFVCPYENGSPKWDDQHVQICADDDDKHIVYGPYKHPQSPKTFYPPPTECSPKNNSFFIQYNISSQCKGKHLAEILGTVLPGSAIILALIVYCLHRRQRKNKPDSSTTRSMSFAHIRLDLEVGSMNGVTVFSYTELEEATNKFDPTKQLGEGGFGVVYHGTLRDGREVAVKRLYEKSYKRIEQFKNEIRILTDLRHQNLVTLYGCTSRHTRELLLVYEYIPNGTVADHLHGEQAESKLLPWSTRMSISIEIATALSYLHFKDIIHRDVKTNNILLDNSFSVKVADFGLSRLFPADVTHVSTAPQGTPGYVDPEYHQCYHLTDKSDVYSFGVVLIELISSLPAVDVGRQRHEINLSNYAMNRIQSSALSELVDPKLGFETDFKVTRMITLVAELASQCLQHERELRPSMEEVKETLKRIASEDYDALEAEETEMSARTTNITKPPPPPPPPPSGNDDAELLRNNRQPPASPVSVMEKWLNSSKSSTLSTSRSA